MNNHLIKHMLSESPERESYVESIATPLGDLAIYASSTGVTRIRFVEELVESKPNEVTQAAAQQLNAYFKGELQAFDLPLDAGGTAFQQEVWRALAAIPFGTTASYGEIAHQINRPKAARAVGAANGQNPIPIVVPCHRVIGATGQLTGFAYGVDRKSWLLNHEQGRQASFPM